MSEGSTILEERIVNREKLIELEKVLNYMKIEGGIETVNGVKIFVDKNQVNLLTIVGDNLYYAVDPYGSFKITSFELEQIKEKLGLEKIIKFGFSEYEDNMLKNKEEFKGAFSVFVKVGEY